MPQRQLNIPPGQFLKRISLRYFGVYRQDNCLFLPATVLNYVTSWHLNIECIHFKCIPRSTWIVRSLHWSECLYVNWIIQEVTLLKCIPRGTWVARPVFFFEMQTYAFTSICFAAPFIEVYMFRTLEFWEPSLLSNCRDFNTAALAFRSLFLRLKDQFCLSLQKMKRLYSYIYIFLPHLQSFWNVELCKNDDKRLVSRR